MRRMGNFRMSDRGTGFLLPPSIDEWLPEQHLARLVVDVVDGLNLEALIRLYRGSGSKSYHPKMMVALIVYGYATGVFSSRKLERATWDSVAFRFIAGNEHPDHDTIAAFRRRFLYKIEKLFVEVLKLAREMGLLKMGTIGLDGTKIHADASRHSALSYEHAGKIEVQLKKEVADLMAKAEAADQSDVPDGMSIPDELKIRENRLQKLDEARAKIEVRAKERHEREMEEHRAALAAREAKEKETGKKPGGRPPAPPAAGPGPKEQINLTDEESRIMPVAGSGFDQSYNAQAAVAAATPPAAGRALRAGPGGAFQSDARGGHGPRPEDARRTAALRVEEADAGAGVWNHQIGPRLSQVFAARDPEGPGRMEPCRHGVELEADVRSCRRMTGKNDARGGRKRGPQASPRRDLSIGGADSETTAASERETAPQTQFKCPQSDGLLAKSQ